MRTRVAFDRPDEGAPDPLGGKKRVWTEIRQCRAEVIYLPGSMAIEAARLQGRSVVKVRLHKIGSAREIGPIYRMRIVAKGLQNGTGQDDPLPGARYNIREVDAETDCKWIYLIAESEIT
jgi:hypothetical protein